MAKKRVHEIAKEQGVTSKDLIAKLQAAGIEVKAAASSVEESDALKALGNGAAPKPKTKAKAKAEAPPKAEAAASGASAAKAEPPAEDGKGAPEAPKKRPTRDSLAGERAPSSGGGRRRVVIDSQASRRADGRGGPPPSQKPRRGRRRGRRRREVEAEVTGDRAAPAARALDVIRINSGSTVKETAESLGVAVPEVIKKLMSLGEMATLTQTLSDEAIQVLAEEFSKQIAIVHAADKVEAEPEFEDTDDDLEDRPPVVTIMGHVDHGKTSLLDAIRSTEVVAGEAGGITQHIGAYQVHHGDKTITFLDTPGHEAFTAMRARGAGVTDVAVIVVAADDGVKPQTDEAIDHAKAADVPILVAVNKIDKEGAQPDRVRGDMAQRNLNPAEWGGDTEFVDVSAKTKQGLDDLLETITVVADLEELKANPDTEASGTVIESKLDPGRGPVVTILVQRGTLSVGDPLVAGASWGKVRAMHDYTGERVKQAVPGMPVEIFGFDGVPEGGDPVRVVENDRRARQLAGERAQRLKTESIARRSGMKVSLEDVFKRAQQGEVQELPLVLKSDVAGSLEALEDEIAKLPQSEVAVTIVHRAVGGINESDVMLAAASEGVVLGFNVRPVGDARAAAEREGVEIRTYQVIYRAIEDLRAAMEGMLEPEEVEESLGMVEIKQLFKASRVGTIAGSRAPGAPSPPAPRPPRCRQDGGLEVTEGRVTPGAKARLVRDGTVVYDGEIASLRRFQDDVREVTAGQECGIVLKDFQDVKEGDILEVYATRKVERELQ